MAPDHGVRPTALPLPGSGSAENATRWLIVVTAAVRVGVAATGHLCYGESYYSAYVRRPSLSYFDHPPLPFWLGALGAALSGEPGPLALRLPFVLLFAATTWLLFAIGRRLWGPWPGFYAALLMNVAPAFSIRVGYWLGPDGPLMFFWLATVWFLIRLLLDPPGALRDGGRRLGTWAAAGAMLGLGLLSKYSVGLLVPGALLYVLTTPGRRRLLLDAGPWLALAVAGLVFAPVLIWNAEHGWISFLWQGQRGVDYRGLRLDWLAWNIMGQSVELGPWLWGALVVELVRIVAGWRRVDAGRRFIGCLAPLPVLLFTALSAYAPIGNHFYWGMAGYLLLLLPLGDTVHRSLVAAGRLARGWLTVSVAAGGILMVVLLSHTATGWLRGLPDPIARPLAGLDDPTLECIDYTELRGALRDRSFLGRRDLFLFTDRWFQSGKVEWAIGGALPVLTLHSKDPRGWAFFAPSEPWVGREGILVTGIKRTRAAAVLAYGDSCSRLDALDPVIVSRGGRPEITLYLYRCERLLRPYPRPYG